MTELECLHKMIILWGYLAAYPGKSKIDAYVTLGLTSDVHDCPCCERCKLPYDKHNDDDTVNHGGFSDTPNCPECPLAEYWPEPDSDHELDNFPHVFPCTHPESDYLQWGRGAKNATEKQKAAQSMVANCYHAINDLRLGGMSNFVSYYNKLDNKP